MVASGWRCSGFPSCLYRIGDVRASIGVLEPCFRGAESLSSGMRTMLGYMERLLVGGDGDVAGGMTTWVVLARWRCSRICSLRF